MLEQERHADDRGYFARTWCTRELAEHGLDARLAPSAASPSTSAGGPRGACTTRPLRGRDEGRPLPPGRAVRRRGRPPSRLADVPPLGGGGAHRGERTGALHPPGLRPRVLHPAPRRPRSNTSSRTPTGPRPRGASAATTRCSRMPWPGLLAVIAPRDARLPGRAARASSTSCGALMACRCDGAAEELRTARRRARPGRAGRRAARRRPRALPHLNRSITGDGLRDSLRLLQRRSPPSSSTRCPAGRRSSIGRCLGSGTSARPASSRPTGGWSPTPRGCNLHLLNYSVPFRGKVRREELRAAPVLAPGPAGPRPLPDQLLPARPGASACHTGSRSALPPGDYQVEIDTTLDDGVAHLRRGARLPGTEETEVLVSTHCCHPSLANDNCAGMVMCADPGPDARRRSEAALRLPLPLRPRDHRGHHLAGPERGDGRTDRPRAGAGVRRRRRPAHLQAEPARRRGRSTAPWPWCSPHSGAAARGARLQPLRLRRAAVQLAGLRPARRLAHPDALRRVPRVPHLGGRPRRWSARRSWWTRSGATWRSSRCWRATRAYRNLQPKCEPQLGKRGLYGSVGGQSHAAGQPDGDALGAEPVGRRAFPARRRRALAPSVPGSWQAARALEGAGLLPALGESVHR